MSRGHPQDLTGFPARTLRAGTPLYRIFRTGRSPGWFSNDGDGRFDLPFPASTYYLAEDPLAALLEVTRGLTLLSEAFLEARQLLTTAASYGYGVTGELSATADYTAPQAWADALHKTGFDGVQYRIRHDPRADLTGVAWFGRSGRLRHPPPSDRQPLPASLLLEAAPFGIRVAADLPEPQPPC